MAYKSPPTLSAVSTVAATTAAKSTAGKFTTANFIETTIQPSPANFGSVDGTATTLAVSALSTTSTTAAVSSAVASVAASTESFARSPTSGYGTKAPTSLSSLSPSGSGFTAKSSAIVTPTATSSPSTFSNTFQNFVGQNYASQLDGGPSDLPTLSSPEIPRGKKRQTKCVFSVFHSVQALLVTYDEVYGTVSVLTEYVNRAVCNVTVNGYGSYAAFRWARNLMITSFLVGNSFPQNSDSVIPSRKIGKIKALRASKIGRKWRTKQC